MAEKKKRGEFTLSHEELASTEMVLTVFTMLESRGYPGFRELMTIVDDPVLILKIIRFLYGMNLKVPPLKEFIDCLQAAEYAFCDMHKNINMVLPAKYKDIRQFLNIDEKREAELFEIYDHWVKYMHDEGYDVRNYMHINRNSTKKRIELAVKGKVKTKQTKANKYSSK